LRFVDDWGASSQFTAQIANKPRSVRWIFQVCLSHLRGCSQAHFTSEARTTSPNTSRRRGVCRPPRHRRKPLAGGRRCRGGGGLRTSPKEGWRVSGSGVLRRVRHARRENPTVDQLPDGGDMSGAVGAVPIPQAAPARRSRGAPQATCGRRPLGGGRSCARSDWCGSAPLARPPRGRARRATCRRRSG
jgi:hypothetical protein